MINRALARSEKELPMKVTTGTLIVCLLLVGAAAQAAEERVYSWTDEQGVMTLTNRPPQDEGRVEHVDRYTVPGQVPPVTKAPAEAPHAPDAQQAADERKKAQDREAAREAAERARAVADEARQKAEAFKQKVGLKKNRLRKNRSRIQKLEVQAELAQEQAEAAEQNARAVDGP